MQLSEIQHIAEVAEKACAAVANHPRNKDLRDELFDLLGQWLGWRAWTIRRTPLTFTT
jgi:hypothetical protein